MGLPNITALCTIYSMNEKLLTILNELKEAMQAHYGSRLVDLLLYGSQARGEAKRHSDIDVMVILTGDVDPWVEIERAGTISADISLKHDVVISCIYIPISRYTNDKSSPLLKNVRREGVKV